MKIGELAREAGCDVETVRFYEREGLLAAPAREASGYRRYGEPDLARLRFVRHCRSLDIPLAEVRQLIDFAAEPASSCAAVNGLLDRQIELVRQRLSALRQLEEQLATLRRTCHGPTAEPCAILASFVAAAEAHACACHPKSTAVA